LINNIIGVDLGGTKVTSGRIFQDKVLEQSTYQVPSSESEDNVLKTIFQSIDDVFTKDVTNIGVGVPSIVDIEKGIVYNVENIPSWKEVYLKDILENRYQIPVQVNNDANCFALGVKHFGVGKSKRNIVCLTLGTGLGAGIIINSKLYAGNNCSAGEIGMLPYLNHNYEYYCSGQFFKNEFSYCGEEIYNLAKNNDKKSLEIFNLFGKHIGNLIHAVLLTYDPEMIVFGGSVSKTYDYFQKSMAEEIKKFKFDNISEKIEIKVNDLDNIALPGAAALFYDTNEGLQS